MASLRTHKKNGNYDEELRKQLMGDIKCIEADIEKLQAKKMMLQKDLLELKIKPFKIGDYAIASIPSGRSTKEQKCLLECENGILYLRPVKPDGELSGRHFSCTVVNKPYTEVLKKVEE